MISQMTPITAGVALTLTTARIRIISPPLPPPGHGITRCADNCLALAPVCGLGRWGMEPRRDGRAPSAGTVHGQIFLWFFFVLFLAESMFFLYKSWSVWGWLDLTCKVNDNLVSIWMSKYSLYIVKLSKKQWWKNVIWLGKKEEALKKNIHPWEAHQGSGRPRPDIDNRYWTSWIKGIY